MEEVEVDSLDGTPSSKYGILLMMRVTGLA
jgi:hypothetical protein